MSLAKSLNVILLLSILLSLCTCANPDILSFKQQTIFYKGIMPSEKVLDLPMDCNTLTGSVNL